MLRAVALLASLSLNLPPSFLAQAPAPPASPSLAETLAFINTAFDEQGPVTLGPRDSSSRMAGQRLESTGECAWRYSFQMESSEPLLGDGRASVDLPLRQLDAKTMALSTRTGALTVHDVTIARPVAEKTSDTDAPVSIATLKARDTAERVAKAYVHALVLCNRKSTF